ncbi:hypothetical protein MsAg5_05350 [Methanosarcinaceae archaeon Ag5]|uniref:GLUG domain-containing protein n=1 Tax=Methanolapillus africanus TaxID=3028297 RepID=A0AAE4MHG3_9EURY|nr:hypothetical protein [Methanosarcinaceae archaeon Ag5]
MKREWTTFQTIAAFIVVVFAAGVILYGFSYLDDEKNNTTVNIDDETARALWGGGNGTPNDPYLIYNATQLHNIRYGLDKSFKLMADIDLDAEGFDNDGDPVNGNFEPIGKHEYNRDRRASNNFEVSAAFRGNFDGNGHTISNMHLDLPDNQYVGLFGFAVSVDGKNNSISNVTLVNMTADGHRYVGSVAGVIFSEDNSTMSVISCNVSGFVNCSEDSNGGIVGAAGAEDGGNTTIQNCIFTGTMNGNNHVGGIIGEFSSDNATMAIISCTATKPVAGLRDDIGGIVGGFSATNCGNSSVISCQAVGVSRGEKMVGGIAGSIEATNDSMALISNCSSNGDVVGENSNIGGIVGFVYAYDGITTISSCFSTGTVISEGIQANYTTPGGVGGLVGSGKNENVQIIDSEFIGIVIDPSDPKYYNQTN